VIHVNTSALLVGALVGRPGGARVIWHVHELVVRPRIANWVFRLAPLTASRVIAISRAVRDHVSPRGLGRRRVAVVWNGIEDRARSPKRDPDRPVVGFVGRLNRWKGWDVFLEAVALTAPAFPNARFLVAGEPPPGEEWRRGLLNDQLTRLGLTGRVDVRGFESDVPALLDGVAIAVVPSIWPEPFGLITLEAMRAGCAVIASAHGGSLDLIESGASGVLVPPGDSSSLAAAISTLLAAPVLRDRLGDSAHGRSRTVFTELAFLDGVERAYAVAQRKSGT
jgi:glycosyltransferase involved in cell wall biosynthesis